MAAHIAVDPNSVVPVVGASGAIAGVMGAYLVLYPNAPIVTAIILVFIPLFRRISAKWLLGFWFVSQFLLTQPGRGVGRSRRRVRLRCARRVALASHR